MRNICFLRTHLQPSYWWLRYLFWGEKHLKLLLHIRKATNVKFVHSCIKKGGGLSLTDDVECKISIKFVWSIDPFTITAVLHSSGTFVSEKMMISRKNRDVINAFNRSTTLFYGKGYYYRSQMSPMNAGLQLSWKGSILYLR